MKNQLIGIGYESNRTGGFRWLTIYRGLVEDFENIMLFIKDYYEERNSA